MTAPTRVVPLPAGGAGGAAAALPLGAHLVTPRRLYTHHGIYVGDGRVVHYAGLSRGLWAGPVEEVSLEEFANGRPVAVLAEARGRFLPAEVVARARSRLGENLYRLVSNNCEHFCAWCVSGEARSAQVERFAARLRALRIGFGRRWRELSVAVLGAQPRTRPC
jgi:hypothetical protein